MSLSRIITKPAAVAAPGRAPFVDLAGAKNAAAASFADTMVRALESVNSLQLDAQKGAGSLADGSAANVHSVTIALEQANIALQLTTAVRNKVVEAYQEVMRITV